MELYFYKRDLKGFKIVKDKSADFAIFIDITNKMADASDIHTLYIYCFNCDTFRHCDRFGHSDTFGYCDTFGYYCDTFGHSDTFRHSDTFSHSDTFGNRDIYGHVNKVPTRTTTAICKLSGLCEILSRSNIFTLDHFC